MTRTSKNATYVCNRADVPAKATPIRVRKTTTAVNASQSSSPSFRWDIDVATKRSTTATIEMNAQTMSKTK